jgi:hypothetical protein
MECFVQYLDDLEDLCYAFALKWERIRAKLRFTLFVAAAFSLQLAGVFLALVNPPSAVALVAVLVVWLLWHGVVSHTPVAAANR